MRLERIEHRLSRLQPADRGAIWQESPWFSVNESHERTEASEYAAAHRHNRDILQYIETSATKCRDAGLPLRNNDNRAVDCLIPSMYPLALIPAQ